MGPPADVVALSPGRLYLANPDLPQRIANGWPLAAVPDPKTWSSAPYANPSEWL